MSDICSRHDHVIVPPGDVLIHAGDSTMAGRGEEIAKFDHWLARTGPGMPFSADQEICVNWLIDFCGSSAQAREADAKKIVRKARLRKIASQKKELKEERATSELISLFNRLF